MARDFENMDDIEDLDDDELRGLVREHLSAHNGLDIDDITVRIESGTVVLEGRVGTDGERLIAEHILTDVIGLEDFRNDLFVDASRRAESPEAIDEHLADEDRRAGLLLGDRAVPINPESDSATEESDDALYGTTDVGSAIENANPWIPPESPTQEGMMNDRRETGEDH